MCAIEDHAFYELDYIIFNRIMQITIKILDYVLNARQLDLHLKSGADHIVYSRRTIFRSHCYTTDELVLANDLNSE